ncbi:MAG TPA: M48 family metallopeptidase [Rhizomicrobium sp.]|jgi:STE24 endopeptidase|nr:M48 family metallopeptidase [Rhizomicrobium sp.]
MTPRTGLVLAALLILLAPAAGAQDLPPDQQLPPHAAPTQHVEVGQLPALDTTPQYDPDAATNAYLARVSGTAREKSDAYTNGGYGLALLNLVYGLAVAGLLLWLQISARVRDWAEARSRSRIVQAMLYGVIYVSAITAASLPLSLYEGFFRQHAYGLSNQSFADWAGDFATLFGVTLVAAAIFLPVFYAVLRKARHDWWLWGAGAAILFMVAAQVIYPLAVAPLFNHYSALPKGPLKQDILSLARANGISTDIIWLADESRQWKGISANVSGFLGTTRITLNDNLLSQGTHDEVLAVLGHEMGHYVMDHTVRLILLMGLVIIAGFAAVAFAFRLATGLFGGNWQVRQPDDIAGLPLLVALMSIFLFLATPVTNSIVRSTEAEADLFGVNAVRKPDAFASLVLKLSPYRKLDPGGIEEALLYDHPSGRNRIAVMTRWKKEHIRDLDIRDTVAENPH